MCGIFGCIGHKNLIKQTLQGLKILEYRGYDSAGIAYRTNKGNLKVIKAVGGIDQLTAKVIHQPPTTVCIGHTRWATNGPVSENNSHPHLSQNGQIAVVHNGIIENYGECKEYLQQLQVMLHTDVDTEVIPNILYYHEHRKHHIHNYLQGQYVFCAFDNSHPDHLFLAKKGNLPLYIGRTDHEFYITSDTLALPYTVNQILALQDLDTCEVSTSGVKIYHQGTPTARAWQPFTQSFITTEKHGFSTYMAKEINETPEVLAHLIQMYQNDTHLLTLRQDFHKLLSQVSCIHVCGCGTSYHAGLIIARQFEKLLQIRAIAHISSEFTADTILDSHDLAIVISQSGETADTLSCMDILQANHIPIIALCNVTTSTIAQKSQICLPLLCGPEIAVASTKVFCAAVLVGCILTNKFTKQDYQSLISAAQTMLNATTKLLPLPNHKPNKIFFIGKGLDYYLALEAALKVKEITYTHCEGYPANELKHGPLALIDQQTLAIVYTSPHTTNACAEITARGGKIFTISDDHTKPLNFIAKIIPAQIFALNMAQQLGINPDKPRNLAKSVTVL